jgi:hypothetical protein
MRFEAEFMKFHDAVLWSVEFIWAEKKVCLTISPVSVVRGVVKVTFEGVRGTNISSDAPWGDSSSINSLEERADAGEMVYRVEMQSGDIIEIRAMSMTIGERSTLPGPSTLQDGA